MDRTRTLLVTLASVVLLMSAVHLARHMTQASGIWWTPKGLSPSLTEVADRVEVYIRDGRLDEHVTSGRLQLIGDASPTTVTASEIRFRFNNWDRVRAQEIPALLVSAAMLGASSVTLLFGVLGWVRASTVRRRPA